MAYASLYYQLPNFLAAAKVITTWTNRLNQFRRAYHWLAESFSKCNISSNNNISYEIGKWIQKDWIIFLHSEGVWDRLFPSLGSSNQSYSRICQHYLKLSSRIRHFLPLHLKIKSYSSFTLLKVLWNLVNPSNANFTKWSNNIKQFVGNLPTNWLSVFDHFVGLAFKGLRIGYSVFSYPGVRFPLVLLLSSSSSLSLYYSW